jgi:uncharacterized membrane protein YjgN (DUF898 family)
MTGLVSLAVLGLIVGVYAWTEGHLAVNLRTVLTFALGVITPWVVFTAWRYRRDHERE